MSFQCCKCHQSFPFLLFTLLRACFIADIRHNHIEEEDNTLHYTCHHSACCCKLHLWHVDKAQKPETLRSSLRRRCRTCLHAAQHQCRARLSHLSNSLGQAVNPFLRRSNYVISVNKNNKTVSALHLILKLYNWVKQWGFIYSSDETEFALNTWKVR